MTLTIQQNAFDPLNRPLKQVVVRNKKFEHCRAANDSQQGLKKVLCGGTGQLDFCNYGQVTFHFHLPMVKGLTSHPQTKV